MTAVEKITMDDIRNNHQKVLDFLDQTFFTDSTVFMMPEEYIKKSVIERLLQISLLSDGIAVLDRDPQSLSRAMLRASLSEQDVNFILNASLRISGISLNVSTAADSEKETPEKANEMITKQMDSMASVENIINIIEECLGTSRISLVSSEGAIQDLLSQISGTTPTEFPKDTVVIERPLVLNTAFINLKKISNEAIFDLFSNLMATDSNSTLNMEIPIACFTDDVINFLEKDLPAFSEVAAAHALTLNQNTPMFVAEADGFQSLFNSL